MAVRTNHNADKDAGASPAGGVIDIWYSAGNEYSWLSNLAERPFNMDANRWQNVESYFQWKKAMLFRDNDAANLIKQSDDPYRCRQIGRRVQNFIPGIWNQMKEFVMENAIRASFEQNPGMLERFKALYGAVFTHVKGGSWAEDFPRILTRVQEDLVLGCEERSNLFDAELEPVRKAYAVAKPVKEVIVGNYAKEFSGTATWSRALDFGIHSWPEFKGVRYIDFKDCTNIHILKKDGNSISVEGLTLRELKAVSAGVRNVMKMKPAKTKSSGPRI